MRVALVGADEQRIEGGVVAEGDGFGVHLCKDAGELLQLRRVPFLNGDQPEPVENPARAGGRSREAPHHFLGTLLPAPTDGEPHHFFEPLVCIGTAPCRRDPVLPLRRAGFGLTQTLERAGEECAAQIVLLTPCPFVQEFAEPLPVGTAGIRVGDGHAHGHHTDDVTLQRPRPFRDHHRKVVLVHPHEEQVEFAGI